MGPFKFKILCVLSGGIVYEQGRKGLDWSYGYSSGSAKMLPLIFLSTLERSAQLGPKPWGRDRSILSGFSNTMNARSCIGCRCGAPPCRHPYYLGPLKRKSMPTATFLSTFSGSLARLSVGMVDSATVFRKIRQDRFHFNGDGSPSLILMTPLRHGCRCQ